MSKEAEGTTGVANAEKVALGDLDCFKKAVSPLKLPEQGTRNNPKKGSQSLESLRQSIIERLGEIAQDEHLTLEQAEAVVMARAEIKKFEKAREGLGDQATKEFDTLYANQLEALRDTVNEGLRNRPNLFVMVTTIESRMSVAGELAKKLAALNPGMEPDHQRRCIASVLDEASRAVLIRRSSTSDNVFGRQTIWWPPHSYEPASSQEWVLDFYGLLGKSIEGYRLGRLAVENAARKALQEQGFLISRGECERARAAAGTLRELIRGECEYALVLVFFRGSRSWIRVEKGRAVAATDFDVARLLFAGEKGGTAQFKPCRFRYESKGEFSSESTELADWLAAHALFEQKEAHRQQERERILAVKDPITKKQLLEGVSGLCPIHVEHWRGQVRGGKPVDSQLAFVFEGLGNNEFRVSRASKGTMTNAPFLTKVYDRPSHLDCLKRDRRLAAILYQDTVETDRRVREIKDSGAVSLSDKKTLQKFISGEKGTYILDFTGPGAEGEWFRYIAVLKQARRKFKAVELLGNASTKKERYAEAVSLSGLTEGWLRWALRRTCDFVLGAIPNELKKSV